MTEYFKGLSPKASKVLALYLRHKIDDFELWDMLVDRESEEIASETQRFILDVAAVLCSDSGSPSVPAQSKPRVRQSRKQAQSKEPAGQPAVRVGRKTKGAAS